MMQELHQRLAPGASYILMVVADDRPAVAFYQRHGLVEEARVDGPSYMHEHMGVSFPPGTPAVPCAGAPVLEREVLGTRSSFTVRNTRRSAMSVYLVDRNLPGITMEQLAAAQQSAIETSRRFT